nr:MAG: hypothetical protein [Bacteriophage sp.]
MNNIFQESTVTTDTGRVLWSQTGFQFLAVSLVDGTVLAELPELQLTRLSYRFEESTRETATLPWHNICRNWSEATTPYQVAVLLVRDETVLWGGIVVKRERSLESEGITLTLVTVEHYLDSVYVGNHSYSNRDQCDIVKDLVTSTLAGHRFNLLVEASPSSIRRDRNYDAESDKTLLSALQELANVINGPEWCTMWRKLDDGRYTPVLKVADRIGSSTVATTFDGSAMTSFTVTEDYTSGYGANWVLAVSTADAGERPQSDVMTVSQPNRPVVEHVFQPSSSITNKETLDAHAQSTLLQMMDGTRTVKMGLSLLAAPMIYQEWQPGDLISWDIDDSRGFFTGFSVGSARIVGYEIDFTGVWTITPVLQDEVTNAGQIQVQS